MSDEAQLPDSKGTTAGKVLQWIVTIGIGLGTLGPYIFPEKFASEIEEATIHEDVKLLKEEVKSELRVEYEQKLKESNWVHVQLKKRISDIERQNKTFIKLLDASQLHREWNTKAVSIHSELFREQLKRTKRIECPTKFYYESNAGDDWNIFDDRYESRMIYSIDRRSDCRAYYTPIQGSKTLAN